MARNHEGSHFTVYTEETHHKFDSVGSLQWTTENYLGRPKLFFILILCMRPGSNLLAQGLAILNLLEAELLEADSLNSDEASGVHG